MLIDSSFRKLLIAVGVGLLVLGAALIYVSESRHLDNPQPRYILDTAHIDGGPSPSLAVFDPAALEALEGVWNPDRGKPTFGERYQRRQAMKWGIASLVLGSAVLVGALLMKKP